MAFDRSAEGHREIRSQRSAASGAVERGRIKLTGSLRGVLRLCGGGVSCRKGRGVLQDVGLAATKGRLGDLPMPDKTSGRPRKRATKGEAPRTGSVSAAPARADQ